MLFSIDKIFNRKSHVGVSIGKFFNFNFFFKQLLSVKIFLGQKKNNLELIYKDHNFLLGSFEIN